MTYVAPQTYVQDIEDEDGSPPGVEPEEAAQRRLIQERSTEGLIIASVYLLIASVAFTVWIALVWPALPVLHGYPSVGVSPGAPGEFVSQRYTSQWIFTYLLVINYAALAFLALATATPGRISGIFLHYVASLLSGVVNFISGVVLLVLGLWYCNGTNATWNAMANDVHWCCVHAASSAIAAEICGAIAPMCTPSKVRSDLMTNQAYFWNVVGTWIAFFVISFGNLLLNWKLKDWRVWSIRG